MNRIYITALLVLLVCACKSVDSIETQPSTRSVAITLNQPSLTRTIVNSSSGGLIDDGYIFFYGRDGKVYEVRELPSFAASEQIEMVFNDIDYLATNIYVTCNLEDLTRNQVEREIVAMETIDNLLTYLIELRFADQPQWAICPVVNTLDAQRPDYNGVIVQDPVSKNYRANVLLAPVLSALQITDIVTHDPRIVSYELYGIYVDNYLAEFSLTTTTSSREALVSVGTDASKLGDDINCQHDNTENFPALRSNNNEVSASDFAQTVCKSGDRFHYNIAPADSVPKVIIHLKNIEYIDVNGLCQTLDNGYLTIGGYHTPSGEITQFTAGTIYNIDSGDLTFKYDDISNTPNEKDREVCVAVQIAPWTHLDHTIIF